jgi:uncharacterized membrane protein
VALIAAENTFLLGAIVFALAWFGLWIDRQPIASKVPGVPWVIGIALLLSNTGVTPRDAPIYGFVGQYLLPLGIALLLFKANLRSIFKTGGWVLPAFLVASLGLTVGAILGFYVFDLGESGAKIAGTYAGAFIGGMVNFTAIAQAVEMDATVFSVALSASAPVSVLGLLVLVSLPSSKFILRHIPSRIVAESATAPSGAAAAVDAPRLRVDRVAASLALALGICAVARFLIDRFDPSFGHYYLFVVTAVTVALATSLPKFFGSIESDFALGMLCMYAFFAMIGSGTDALGFVKSAPVLFFYCAFLIAVQFVVLLVVAKLMKWDLAEVVIGSAAAIVGPAAGAGIASAKGWGALVTPAIAIGMLGYAIANFIGIAIVKFLS